ncbi:helix-turn-helix domain-containing protein [Chryseobacterium pyrolae]|uniref:helix-turn-helix domain-containing protein n=1 Tax=Chryseobacterium pyrolae TaxID=2987481 RepID=UPI003C2E2D4D
MYSEKCLQRTFGMTVFGFLNTLKMEEFRKMILEKEMSIGEVSDVVGYKNRRHFSTAFKKKFGNYTQPIKKVLINRIFYRFVSSLFSLFPFF